jgi:O-antigen/teichoic acid export membrane protein
VGGSAIAGPPILKAVYQSDLDRRTLTLLALGSALYMMALATAQAVIALHGHKWVALGWTVGMSSFVLTTWLSSNDLFLRIEIASVVSSTLALCVFATALRSRIAAGDAPDVESMMEAMSDRPLEG